MECITYKKRSHHLCQMRQDQYQIVYGYVPEDNVLGDRWIYPGKGGRLMCCKCTSTIGMQQQEVTDWVYLHPKNVVGDFACAYR